MQRSLVSNTNYHFIIISNEFYILILVWPYCPLFFMYSWYWFTHIPWLSWVCGSCTRWRCRLSCGVNVIVIKFVGKWIVACWKLILSACTRFVDDLWYCFTYNVVSCTIPYYDIWYTRKDLCYMSNYNLQGHNIDMFTVDGCVSIYTWWHDGRCLVVYIIARRPFRSPFRKIWSSTNRMSNRQNQSP